LLLYDELNLTQISYKLHYSSVAHLSNQFKKITGLSPSQFKQLKNRKRIPIEEIGVLPSTESGTDQNNFIQTQED
jgi:AraC-like DNA-binding protein